MKTGGWKAIILDLDGTLLHSDDVTESNNDDGVAKYIEKILRGVCLTCLKGMTCGNG